MAVSPYHFPLKGLHEIGFKAPLLIARPWPWRTPAGETPPSCILEQLTVYFTYYHNLPPPATQSAYFKGRIIHTCPICRYYVNYFFKKTTTYL